MGAEGTLGVITAAVMKVFPRPAGTAVALAANTVGAVSMTIGCSWAIAALVCSGTDTAPETPSAMSMVV